MAQKRINIPNIGEVILQKRKGARSIRLSVASDGTLRVSMPAWSPYHMGEAFARSKSDWILSQKVGKGHNLLLPNDRIGKAHRIRFVHEDRHGVSTRISGTEIIIRIPEGIEASNTKVQAEVRKAAIRALKQEAKALLPRRLKALATQHSFSYRSVTIKQLKSRWGSCSSQNDIALNCFLMQLPWELIDYVLLHELLHTQIMAHGPKFWDALNKYVTNLPVKRKAIRTHQPMLIRQL